MMKKRRTLMVRRFLSLRKGGKEVKMQNSRIFRTVIPMEDGCLQVEMESGSTVYLDMQRRMQSVRFGLLRNEDVFRSVETDGYRLIFYKDGSEVLEIPAVTFMDLLTVDRTQ